MIEDEDEDEWMESEFSWFRAILARAKATKLKIEQALSEGVVEFVNPSRPTEVSIITPEVGDTGRYRITRFDERGPYGHTEGLTDAKALVETLFDYNFTSPSPGALKRMMDSTTAWR